MFLATIKIGFGLLTMSSFSEAPNYKNVNFIKHRLEKAIIIKRKTFVI